MLKQDIVREATRLTRSGQLVEATALLQRMFRGDGVPDATERMTGRIALPGREPPTIDTKANTGEEADSPQPRKLHTLLDRTKDHSGFGLRGVTKRAPPSTSDVVPEGTRFVDGTYTNAAGCLAYRLFIPSRYNGQPKPASSAPTLPRTLCRWR